MSFWTAFLVAFIPLFVALDAVGVLPFYVTLVGDLPPLGRRRVLSQAVATAGAAGVGFLFLGKAVFAFLGITVADFKVAGGLILLVFAVTDLLFPQKQQRRPCQGEGNGPLPLPTDTMGVVPIGMPLLVGPAVLTTLVMQADVAGLAPTLAAFAANLVIAVAVFLASGAIVRAIGTGGAQAISKIASLLLAAIGVMMIRVGVLEILGRE
ncbi:MAG: MarC family protein [Planctomycetes bacterium]|nr:MarC family protein [Planctomycetota bacterium]